MKAAKKRPYKTSPKFWKVLRNEKRSPYDQKQWNTVWPKNMQVFYDAELSGEIKEFFEGR